MDTPGPLARPNIDGSGAFSLIHRAGGGESWVPAVADVTGLRFPCRRAAVSPRKALPSPTRSSAPRASGGESWRPEHRACSDARSPRRRG